MHCLQIQTSEAHSHVKPGLALNRKGLKVDAVAPAPHQYIGAKASYYRGLGGSAYVSAFQRTAMDFTGGKNYPTQVRLISDTDVDA